MTDIRQHRLDPPIQHEAARRFGKLVGMRLLAGADCIPILLAAAVKGGFAGDVSGLQTRLSWSLADSARSWEAARIRVDHGMRKMLSPMFDACAAPSEIVVAAEKFNRDNGECLLSYEVRRILDDEAGWWAVRNRRKKSWRNA